MRSVATVSLLAVALLLVPAVPSQAQGHGGGHGFRGGFNGHRGFHSHGVIAISPGMRSRFQAPHGFVRQPFVAWGPWGDWVEPDEVVMVPQFVQQFAAPIPNEIPVPDPKFVSPPTGSAPSPSGSHTVIVQHGSRIEVLSFPTAR